MPPRLRVALALAGLIMLGVIATVAGERRTRRPDDDPRRSTFVYGPAGASGWAGGLERLGIVVERVRDPRELTADTAPSQDALVAVIEPLQRLGPFDGSALADYVVRGGHLLVAGSSSAAAMRCLGYGVELRRRDSLLAMPPGAAPVADAPWVRATLRAHARRVVVDTVEAVSGVISECRVPQPLRVDTLLVAAGDAVAVDLHLEGGGRAVLVADGALFSNRRLRATAAGPFALGLAARRYARVRVDEYHHGYDSGGSLAGALLSWSAESPWGWAVWQLALVGVVALIGSGVRFGPPQPLDERRRRSPLEHVRALATALAAARGHDVAIRLLVQGLRRRLGRGGAHSDDLHGWLASLAPHLRTARAQGAAATLAALTVPPQPAASVLRAANAVEDLWEELRP